MRNRSAQSPSPIDVLRCSAEAPILRPQNNQKQSGIPAEPADPAELSDLTPPCSTTTPGPGPLPAFCGRRITGSNRAFPQNHETSPPFAHRRPTVPCHDLPFCGRRTSRSNRAFPQNRQNYATAEPAEWFCKTRLKTKPRTRPATPHIPLWPSFTKPRLDRRPGSRPGSHPRTVRYLEWRERNAHISSAADGEYHQ